MKKLCIIKTGSAIQEIGRSQGDFEDYILTGAALCSEQAEVYPVFEGAPLPRVEGFDGVVITGSNAMVTDDLPWSLATERWLKDAARESVPILGICYGHQLLARALGASVGCHRGGGELGMAAITLTEAGRKDPLLGVLPTSFRSPVIHTQTVTALPAGCRVLAKNDFEDGHGLAFGDQLWGVQFHPEFSGDYMRRYLNLHREELIAAGWDWETLYEDIGENIWGPPLLRRFASLL